MSHLSTLLATELPSEAAAVQQKTYVKFTCPPSGRKLDDAEADEHTITLLERRHLISGSQTTGFRTWEAALHLGSFLTTPAGSSLIRGKNVFELGAGTGFLTILCAKLLEAKHVTTTDGDEGVVDALKENLFLNDLDEGQKVVTSVLRWGRGLRGTWVEETCEAWPYDTIIGADIVRVHVYSFRLSVLTCCQTYDKIAISALVATLRFLFDLRPALDVIIAGAVRNAETFETFRQACRRLHP